jgi:hypothetical protein
MSKKRHAKRNRNKLSPVLDPRPAKPPLERDKRKNPPPKPVGPAFKHKRRPAADDDGRSDSDGATWQAEKNEKRERSEKSTFDEFDKDRYDDDKDVDPETDEPYADTYAVDDRPYENPQRVAYFSDRFDAAWNKTAEGYLEAARTVLDAKKGNAKDGIEKLPHGDFMKWCHRHLGTKWFTPSSAVKTAEMLRAIAEDPVLTDSKNFSNLPRSWTTAFKLTRLPNDVKEQLFANGTIRSNIRGKEVEQIREKIRRDGSMRNSDLALLSDIAEHWPDPTELAQHMEAPLAHWVAKLHTACRAKLKSAQAAQ